MPAITAFAHTMPTMCPLTYSMSIDNATGTNIISFDDTTRIITIGSTDNQYGDATFVVTITATNGAQSDSLSFNVITTKDCNTVTAPSPPSDLSYKVVTAQKDLIISTFDQWCHIDYSMTVSASPTPSGSNIISFDPASRTVSVHTSSLSYSGNTYVVTITGTRGASSDSLNFNVIVTDCSTISTNFEVDTS